MELLPSDWSTVFTFETPILELIARGSALYLGILVLMRFMPRRTGGELAVMDLVFILLIAEAASNAMGDYTSVADGIFLIAVLMGWDYSVNALSYHVPFVERLISSPPIQVVRDGQMLRRNMRREYLTEEELMSHLREQGIERLEEVRKAYIEGEGHITVISRKDAAG